MFGIAMGSVLIALIRSWISFSSYFIVSLPTDDCYSFPMLYPQEINVSSDLSANRCTQVPPGKSLLNQSEYYCIRQTVHMSSTSPDQASGSLLLFHLKFMCKFSPVLTIPRSPCLSTTELARAAFVSVKVKPVFSFFCAAKQKKLFQGGGSYVINIAALKFSLTDIAEEFSCAVHSSPLIERWQPKDQSD